MTPWKPGTPCGRDETFGSSLTGRSLTRRLTGFSRLGAAPRRRATGSRGTSCSSRTGRSWWLAKVWQGAKHVAGAAAAIAIVAPEPQDDRQSALLQYDLGQAT